VPATLQRQRRQYVVEVAVLGQKETIIGTQLKSAFAERHSTQVQKCELEYGDLDKERKMEKLQSAEVVTTPLCSR